MRPARLQYALLLLAAAFSLTYYFSSVSSTLYEIYGDRVPRSPTYHGFQLAVVSGLNPEAREAGVSWGDRILSINGRAFTGYDVLLQELRKSRAGDTMTATLLPHVAGDHAPAPRNVIIRLAPVHAERPGFLNLLGQTYFLGILFPLGCLLLGFWVVAARPRDRNAWLMLGVMNYCAAIFSGQVFWPGPLLVFGAIWNDVSQVLGPLCIMWFGICFPERFRLDVRFPWVKWIPTVLLAALLPLAITYSIGFDFSFSSIAWLVPFVARVFRTMTIATMFPIAVYFCALGVKSGTVTSPDERRRLRILYIGSTVANLPLFLVVLYALVRGRDIGDGVPSYLLLGAIFLFTLFPISLAYVIVVHRAMELRILIRQGTKYALARSSFWIVRGALGAIIGIIISRIWRHSHLSLTDEVSIAALVLLFIFFRYRASKQFSLWLDRRFFREAYSTEQVLQELATHAQGFTETGPLISTVSECISHALHVDRIAILIRSGNTFRLEHAVGIGSSTNVLLSDNSRTIANLDRVKSPANVYLDNPDTWLVAATESERSALRELGAEMLLPLPGRNRMIGVIALGPKRSEEPYSKADRGLLQSVALHTGLSIENSELVRSLALEAGQRERLNREIEIAREVQERFLPQSFPEVPGAEVAGACRPALGVGGDYYDFIEMKGDGLNGSTPLGIAIGDVSGKGISAALLMASLRASLRGITRTLDSDLAAMMREINELVYESSANNRYATFFFARFDPCSRRLTYVNAGHNAPAVLHAGSDAVTRLEEGGPVIGLLPGAEYRQSTLLLQPGDVLLAFTDGISEAMTHEGEEWGEDRLIADLAQCISLPASSIVDCLIANADKFANGAPQHDDMTLLVMKVHN